MTSRTEYETDVAIVGAGGGGAVLALMLAQRGIRSIVLERGAGPPTGLRGEILQPNGQQVLARLGLLNKLPADAVKAVRLFHFCRTGGERLCTVDYGDLPAPYNRALVTLPNVAHHAILKELEAANAGGFWYGTSFTGLRYDGGQVVGLEAECNGEAVRVAAKLVIGADGAFSKVRQALRIETDMHLYSEAYLIAILQGARELTEAKYFVGQKQILGLFPAAGRKVYLFYMIPAGSFDHVKAQGIESLRRIWTTIDPLDEELFKSLTNWDQTAYMPTGRVRTKTWVADGAALLGDAAHAMNPHASQGRMQAMVDAVVLADLIPVCLEKKDYSAACLRAYERARRPHVEMLQRLADEQVMWWNTGNPILAFLRDRVFRTLDRNARLRYRVLATTAGLRTNPPFSLIDRVIAAGLMPDFYARLVSSYDSGS
ncbi:MAG TPA: NAD(P)/FAD-dependent oxidoreductase [Nitrospiraceae bacterium]|nr:NAD(P)/FAD-dependent oxidoreductase [Nitrospiraceae bacterium]